MKLKLDANLGTRGCRRLVDGGHDVSTADIQSLAHASDETLIAACAAEGRALITLDTDFANAIIRLSGTPASSWSGQRRGRPRVTSKRRSELYSKQ